MEDTRHVDETPKRCRVSLIAAIGKSNRALGKNNQLLWHLPEDLERFRTITRGHPVIMGRKTWESLPDRARPLPGRTNIVVTRQSSYEAVGAQVKNSLEEAIAAGGQAPGGEEVFVIGGGELYKEAVPMADKLYLTLIDEEKEGDAFFPPYEASFTKEVAREERVSSTGIHYAWIDLERK